MIFNICTYVLVLVCVCLYVCLFVYKCVRVWYVNLAELVSQGAYTLLPCNHSSHGGRGGISVRGNLNRGLGGIAKLTRRDLRKIKPPPPFNCVTICVGMLHS